VAEIRKSALAKIKEILLEKLTIATPDGELGLSFLIRYTPSTHLSL